MVSIKAAEFCSEAISPVSCKDNSISRARVLHLSLDKWGAHSSAYQGAHFTKFVGMLIP